MFEEIADCQIISLLWHWRKSIHDAIFRKTVETLIDGVYTHSYYAHIRPVKINANLTEARDQS